MCAIDVAMGIYFQELPSPPPEFSILWEKNEKLDIISYFFSHSFNVIIL